MKIRAYKKTMRRKWRQIEESDRKRIQRKGKNNGKRK